MYLTITFRRKYDVKAVSGNDEVMSLLSQRHFSMVGCHNAALGLLYRSSFSHRSNLTLFYVVCRLLATLRIKTRLATLYWSTGIHLRNNKWRSTGFNGFYR